MARIDAAFERLQPVVFLDALGRHGLFRGDGGEFPQRFGRRGFLRAHIGPQHVADLDQRIGGQADLFLELAVLRLRRDIDAFALDVELPAVIGAAQAAFLVAAEPQRHPAVGAEFLQQAVAAVAVAEGDHLFAEQLDPHRRAVVLRQFGGQHRRQPVLPEQLSHGGAGVGLGQQVVHFLAKHKVSPDHSCRPVFAPGRVISDNLYSCPGLFGQIYCDNGYHSDSIQPF